MKKSFSIFIIIAFLFNTAGSLLIFLVLQSSLKEDAARKISYRNFKDDKTVLSFSENDLKNGIPELNFIDEREFSFRGKMYDVITTENKNDSVYFYCLADTDEDELNLAFSKKGNEGDSDKDLTGKNILKNLLQDGILSCGLFSPVDMTGRSFRNSENPSTHSNFSEIPTPPPVLFPA